ncbi:MAG: ABC transporter ATP-binding protein [candidate division Zixibacteria bacterium]|nr:ABC transporter ATP-binding protein [candidate division Zixibacteria bacterium]MDH3938622.1 ABC transporter ATP-binding protein [candidate division Zixibacteria bacterium]MDH4032814.1 ABC transporter ATP-binding protein [candidate division Zixibacteria bacterium]
MRMYRLVPIVCRSVNPNERRTPGGETSGGGNFNRPTAYSRINVRTANNFNSITMVSASVIATSRLTRRYGSLVAVDALDLTVPEGCVYGFLGPNGSGKTTTVRMLLGLIGQDSGSVSIFGGNLKTDRRTILSQVGAMVEQPSLYMHLTGRENLEIHRRLLGLNNDRIDQSLRIVEMDDAADRPVRTYSLGMKQRMGLALALLAEPKLLILDEPTNGLDPQGIIKMRDLIKRLPHQMGASVFLCSHLLTEVEQVADYVGIINQGNLLFEGTLDQLRDRQQRVVRLRADRPDECLSLLNENGWSAHLGPDCMIEIGVAEFDQAAEINKLLTGVGISVYELRPVNPSLESLFLKMTANSGDT